MYATLLQVRIAYMYVFEELMPSTLSYQDAAKELCRYWHPDDVYQLIEKIPNNPKLTDVQHLMLLD